MKAFCFPGQGSQDTTLITELARQPEYKNYQSEVFKVTGLDLDDLLNMSEEQQQEAVRKNEIASLLTIVYALIDLKKLEHSITPDYLTGYSVGQYVALYAAKSIDLETLFTLVWNRCIFMNQANQNKPGRMAAIIGLPEEKTQELCQTHGLEISNYNARGQYTISGTLENLENAIKDSLESGANKSILINTEGAWHSSFMNAAIEPFQKLLDSIHITIPSTPVIDNVTGDFLPNDTDALKAQLTKHLTHAVQWENGVKTLISKGTEEFIEIGYGNMLSKFGFFISRDVKFIPSKQALKASSCAA